MNIHDLLLEMLHADASDLHLVAGKSPQLRIHGVLRAYDGEAPVLEPETVLELAEEFFGFDLGEGSEPLSYTNSVKRHGRRFRGTLLVNDVAASLIVHAVPAEIPRLELLDLPPQFTRILELTDGLVVIAGPHGSGKTSTLLALAEEINRRHSLSICVLDDGEMPELAPGKSVVHMVSYHPLDGAAEAYRYAMIADANVVVGPIEHEHDLLGALRCAQTGCLVLATLHAASVAEALERLSDLAMTLPQGEVLLAELLRVCVSQELRVKRRGGKRAMLEVLWNDRDVASIIFGDEGLEVIPALLRREGNLARE